MPHLQPQPPRQDPLPPGAPEGAASGDEGVSAAEVDSEEAFAAAGGAMLGRFAALVLPSGAGGDKVRGELGGGVLLAQRAALADRKSVV